MIHKGHILCKIDFIRVCVSVCPHFRIWQNQKNVSKWDIKICHNAGDYIFQYKYLVSFLALNFRSDWMKQQFACMALWCFSIPAEMVYTSLHTFVETKHLIVYAPFRICKSTSNSKHKMYLVDTVDIDYHLFYLNILLILSIFQNKIC